MGHHQLDTLDEQILKLIADNARIPFLEVARACNVSGAAIHQRIQKLTNLGILKGSEYIIDPEKIGYETCAYIGIYLKDPLSRLWRIFPRLWSVTSLPASTTCSSSFMHATTVTCRILFRKNCSRWVWRGRKR